jgi:hypothetical protein
LRKKPLPLWITPSAMFVSMALFAYLFFSSAQGPSISTEESTPVNTAIRAAQLEPIFTPSVEGKASLDEESSGIFQKCLPGIQSFENHFANLRTRDLIRSLEPLLGKPIHQDLLWQNVHIELASGERRRLRWFQGDGPEGRVRFQFQYFSEDPEGLPDPIDIPEEHSNFPSAEIIKSYLNRGKPVYEGSGTLALFEPSGTLEMIEENGKLRSFHLISPKASIGCALPQGEDQLECRCL